jgi:hypothetical protein
VGPERIPGFVAQLREYGIEIVGKPTDMLGKIDAVMIESTDCNVHLERATPFLEAGLPIFVDKPFAPTAAEARRLVDIAQKRGVALTSASALRYCPEVTDIPARAAELGQVMGVDTYTPATLHPHGVEMAYALLGTGCTTVRCVYEEGAEVVVGRWGGGRLGSVRGTRAGSYAFGFTAFCEKKVVASQVEVPRLYTDMLKAAVTMFETGTWPLSPEELVEPIAFQEAALRSKERGGDEVSVDV